jgi:hypothetical protein
MSRFEARTIELFAGSIQRAIQMQSERPAQPLWASSAGQFESVLPGFGRALANAVNEDAGRMHSS